MTAGRPEPGRARQERAWSLLPWESAVPCALPDWHETVARVLASPEMGASFAFYDLELAPRGGARKEPAAGLESFFLVLAGEVRCDASGGGGTLAAGAFVYMPPAARFTFIATSPSRLLWYARRYVPGAGSGSLHGVTGAESHVAGRDAGGIPGARVQPLLPDDPAWDFTADILELPAGAASAAFEVHAADRALCVLSGSGACGIAGEWVDLRPGDLARVGPGLASALAADEATALRVLVVGDTHRDAAL